MENIRVPKEKLLETLKENRDAHREEFLEAQTVFRELVVKTLDDYRQKCEEILDDRLEQARAGKVVTLQFALPALVRAPEPRDYTEDYDRAIEMLKWEVAAEVELGERDFQRYVLNDWDWAHDFAANTQVYASLSPR